MATFLKSILGNGSNREALTSELRSLLAEINTSRDALIAMVERADTSRADLAESATPLAEVQADLSSVQKRVEDLDASIARLTEVADRIDEIESQARDADAAQRAVETRLAHTSSDADRIRSDMDGLRDAVETAGRLKEELADFVSLQGPFNDLRKRTDGFATELRTLQSGIGEMRSQHEEAMRIYGQASARFEALDSGSGELRSAIEVASRKVDQIDARVSDLAEVAKSVEDTARELEALNTLAGFVRTKVAGLEHQREAVERAASQAQHLHDTMRKIDDEAETQLSRESELAELSARIEEVRQLHARAITESDELATRQREIDVASDDLREQLGGLRDQLRKTVEKFDLENRGLDAVSQRIVDLRNSLIETEQRFESLDQTQEALASARANAESLTARVQTIGEHVAEIDGHATRVQAVGADVERVSEVAKDLSTRVMRMETAKPAIDDALENLGQLKRSREAVIDALEHTCTAHDELLRYRQEQKAVSAWIDTVDGSVTELREKVDVLNDMRPQIELLSKDIHKVNKSTEAVESRREFLEDMHRRMTEIGTFGAQLEGRIQQLDSRMEGAEQRFVALALRAEEAERVERSVFNVIRQVEEAERRAVTITEMVTNAEKRATDMESLAERVRLLGNDLEQRQSSLEKASEHLEHASTLREEAAAAAESLEEQTSRLTAALDITEARSARLDAVGDQLESRSSDFRFVEKRISQFEERLAKWELTEGQVQRGLDEIAARQTTVDKLRADITEMFELAERTMSDVRAVADARQDVAETRDMLTGALERLADANGTVERLEHRKRQIEQAEKRFARADALLRDLRGSLETLEAQRAIIDRVVDQAGVLEFQSKHGEAVANQLREERELASRMYAAIAAVRSEDSEVPAAS